MQKIRYRLCFNYANRLNKQGYAPVALECRQGQRKIYISSKVMLRPEQWGNGMVINHDNGMKLTAYLVRWMHEIEEIELDGILKGKNITLYQLKMAIKSGIRSNTTIKEFVESVIMVSSNRKDTTKRGYKYLVDEIENTYGKLTIDDITHDFIEKYRSDMRKEKLSENTIKGRLKLMRCLINEALKRSLITDDPFKFITIGDMSARQGYLSNEEVEEIGKLELKDRKERHIRDAFIFCCYVGLRYSDFVNLKTENINNNILSLKQQKTRNSLNIPLEHLFDGKPLEIISKYRSVESFAKIGCNTTVNRALKEIAKKAGINRRLFWHLARHTCATLLNQAGLRMQEIQKILGHSKMETTYRTYAETSISQIDNSLRRAFTSGFVK